MKYFKKELFGGAITSEVPEDWKDLSDVRPIPDNQECFQDDLCSENPRMMVIEILERQEHVEDHNAAVFFFNDLAERNDALQDKNDIQFHTWKDHALPTALLSDESIVAGENTIRCTAGSGFQKVATRPYIDDAGKLQRESENGKYIRVDLYVLRLPVQETDLLISMSQSVETEKVGEMPFDNLSETNTILQKVISSFRIHDWGLFG
mmetsp:Transcript_2879/g.7905  ORF Transcript_2879/g.7905 Transcript_2879/m.7905 type:complete len:207 (-) Transcript_2879:1847-2467(-)